MKIEKLVTMSKRKWLKFDRRNKLEGWALFDADGNNCIFTLDDVVEVGEQLKRNIPDLKSDEMALAYVTSQAIQGSLRHILALYLHGSPISTRRFPMLLKDWI